MSSLIKIDNDYKNWITEISNRFRQTQLRAAVKTNSDMLRFYWSLGRDIVGLSVKNNYGSGFYKTISEDLKEIFPDIKSFSPTNLKYMRYFYEMYPTGLNRHQLGDDSENELNRPQAGDDLENAIFFIPWGHNKVIIDKCKGDSAKALFYVKKTLENNWSRDVLLNFLDTDLYERQGNSGRLPINKYLSEATKKFEECEIVAAGLDFEHIISNTIKKNRRCLGQYTSVMQIWNQEKSSLERATRLISHLTEDKIDVAELEKVLQEIFTNDANVLETAPDGTRSHIRRLILVYDYLKWGK